MPLIDPTARIAPGAELGEDVVIGPFCQVGPRVKIGAGAVLESSVLVEGDTEIGPRCRLHHGAVVGTAPQDLKYAGAPSRVRVGADTVFREYATLNRATEEGSETRVGDGCLVMAYAHVAHNCHLGNNVILANAANLAGHVEVGDWAIIGGVTPVHQFVKIGAHVMIGGGSRVPKDVAPYTLAAGSPLRVVGINRIGLARRGFSPDQISAIRRAYQIFFRSALNTTSALERIRREIPMTPEVELFLRFVESSTRGLHRPSRRRRSGEEE